MMSLSLLSPSFLLSPLPFSHIPQLLCVAGERPLLQYLEPLEKIKSDKVRECASLKSPAGGPALDPSSKPREDLPATIAPSAPSSAKPAVKTSSATTAVKASSAGSTRPAVPGKAPAGKAPAGKPPAGKAPAGFPVDPAEPTYPDVSAEEAAEGVGAIVGDVALFSSANWKERSDAAAALQAKVYSVPITISFSSTSKSPLPLRAR